MRRLAVLLAVLALVAAGCGSGDDDAAAPTTVAAAPATTVTTVATTTTTRLTAATAVIEPHMVAGIPLGATKAQAIAVLGPATRTSTETDLGGATYDALSWDFSGSRGLSLAFATSGGLTDWKATAPGPATKGGVQVGDTAAKAAAAHGALEPFCCETRVASLTQGGGRMLVIVGNGSQKVDQILGGDQASWQRKIAD